MEAPNQSDKGRAGEDLAARFLELEGYEVMSRNVRCADVEVDLLARRGRLLVLVEVKLRRRGLVRAADGVREPQRRRLLHAARALLARYAWAEEVRLDVVGVDWNGDGDLRLSHLPGVFGE